MIIHFMTEKQVVELSRVFAKMIEDNGEIAWDVPKWVLDLLHSVHVKEGCPHTKRVG